MGGRSVPDHSAFPLYFPVPVSIYNSIPARTPTTASRPVETVIIDIAGDAADFEPEPAPEVVDGLPEEAEDGTTTALT